MSMNIRSFFLLLFLLILSNSLIAQVGSTNSSWVSISNEFVTVSVDRTTGRYIIYDNINYHPYNSDNTFFPREFLQATSPIPETELSSVLGEGTNAFNVTTINIDNTPVVFGSSGGQWVSAPSVSETSIIYPWSIGNLNIVQTLSIVTNPETLFPDAVQISYDVFNNDTQQSRNIATRMVLDPTINDKQNQPFFITDNRGIKAEYAASLGALPESWIAADQNGQISSLSIKGLLQDPSLIKPRQLHLTSIDRALKDIWEYSPSRNSLKNKDSAVVLFFDNTNVSPFSSVRVASTIVSIPSLLTSFTNNGLEARVSSFINKNTTPISVSLWLQNTSPEIYDAVELELVIPNTLISYDTLTKRLNDVGVGSFYPVTWNVEPKNINEETYNLIVNVKGFRNGVQASQFDVPMIVNISPNFESNNTKDLTQALDRYQQSANQLNTNNNNTISIMRLDDEAVLGASIDNLSKIQQYLQANPTAENRQIITMIETEQQLIREILQLEKGIHDINSQYEILAGIYKRLYQDQQAIDREQINIQGLIDNMSYIEESLKQQQQIISNIISNSQP